MAIIPLSENASNYLADAFECYRLSADERRRAIQLACEMGSRDPVLLFHMRIGVERVLKEREENGEDK